jgi:hypothetical protein
MPIGDLWWRALGGGPGRAPDPSRPPTHTPAPSRNSPLQPRAGMHWRALRACPFCGPHRAPSPLALGWGSARPARAALGEQSRDPAHASPSLHPARPGPSGERIGQAEGALRSRQEPAHVRAAKGREFAPAPAERGRGQSGICRTADLSAARMDTDGPAARMDTDGPLSAQASAL